MTVTYHLGDTREVTATIPDGSVSLIATSPPFLCLRSYLPADHPLKHAEIGSEPDPATFLDTLLALTAEWGRVLAPWGSIAVELGDTYTGAGGYGSPESLNPAFSGPKRDRHFEGRTARRFKTKDDGWPLAKSLALIPQLYAIALAYGINPLTGQPSPAGRWRVRNVIVWHRPNPAVGALGDKVRPSTSYIVVATRSDKRWFDLTAVRGEGSPNTHARTARGVEVRETTGKRAASDGNFDTLATEHRSAPGTPPLDCWFDAWDGSHDTWTVTTQPSSIKAEIVERVQCGPDDGGERTTSPDCPVHGDHAAPAPTERCDEHGDASSSHTPRSGTRRGQEPVPAEPRDALTSTRSGQPTATGRSTASSRTAPAPSTSQPGMPSVQTADDTARTSTSPESSEQHRGTPESSSGEACPPADAPETQPHSDHTSSPSSACTCSFHIDKTTIHSHYAMWPAKLAERLILSMCPAEVCTACATPRRRMEGKTPEYAAFRASKTGVDLTDARVAYHLPSKGGAGSLDHRDDSAARGPKYHTLGWTDCGCGAGWTPGVVLDPFAGTGTTLAVADLHGRDAIGIDIDSRNRDLYPARREEVARSLFGTKPELPGQLDMFGDGQ